jgi:hypothetical protein
MTTFDSIHNQARTLSAAEQIRLAELLLREARDETSEDEAAIGRRGLAAWTDSAQSEDWSSFYPASLRRRKVG